MAKRAETRPVIIKIPKGAEKTAENLIVYVVDGDGSVTESHPLGRGETQLKSDLKNAKLYIAPKLSADLEGVTLNEKKLLNMGAWQPSVRLNNNVFQIPYFPTFHFPIPF